jgi:hypothetical protein
VARVGQVHISDSNTEIMCHWAMVYRGKSRVGSHI